MEAIMKNDVNIERLATMTRTKRGSRGLREVAIEIGNISPSTLSRVENGKMPDLETFLLLCDWLEVSAAEFIRNTQSTTSEAEKASVANRVDILLRADKNLDPATANALAALVKAAYRDLSGNSQS